LLAFVVASGET